MTFVNFSLLFGGLLVAVPIVLHLVMRQKPRLLEFPALRFIQKRHEANRRRLRLQHLLLLLLRAGVIAFLAFALARPTVQFAGSLGSQEAPVAAALIFDTAARMEYRQDNQTRLETAKRLGLWLLSQLPPDSQIAVLDARREPAHFQVERGAAEQRIKRLAVTANADSLTDVVERALRLLERSELPRREVYIFSDLALKAWPTANAARLHDLSTAVPGTTIQLIDVGVPEPSNFALGELRLSSQVLSSRGTLTIQCDLLRMAAPSEPASQQRSVELFLLDENRQGVKRAEQSYTVEPGKGAQVEFSLGALPGGTNQGYLRIVGQDGLAADDVRYFTVAVKPAWRILLAAPNPAQRYALFLREALAPTELRKRGHARFDCQVVDLRELANMNLEQYAAVCLLDPTALEPGVWQKLGDFAASGHGLAIFLGRNARPLESFNQPLAQELLPGKLARQARRPDGDCYLAPRNYQHPMLAGFARLAGSIPWEALPVFRYWQFEGLSPQTSVVASLSDQSPLILERPLGAGRVVTMATPVSDRPAENPWNLLPAGGEQAWPFVMLMNQLMFYLVGAADQQLNYYAGQTVLLALDPQEHRRNFLLVAPDATNFPLIAESNQQHLAITATEQVGNYQVLAGGEESGVSLGFSVNLAPEQTDLTRASQTHFDEIFGPFPYSIRRDREEIVRQISSARVGRELFTPLILLVAALLLGEHLVANRFYQQ